jgi:DNA (cytosine-5)-methyltransferase 1
MIIKRRSLKFIDLFCGIGGFRVALEERGFQCVFSSDIDLRARKAYEKNFGEAPSGDITKIHESEIPEHDILCAGFPCQSFSISGKMGGVSDPRGQLFYEIKRIAEYRKPSVLLLENVKNILSIDGGNVVKTIKAELDEIGYDLHFDILNASLFGVPQARERVYFVALRKDAKLSYEPPAPTLKRVFLKDVLEKNIDKDFSIIDPQKISWTKSEAEEALKLVRIGTVNKGGQGERIYSVNGHAATISAYGGGIGAKTGLYDAPQGVRRLTILECKRVMGFPENHFVSDGFHGYRQLGNAVIPVMIGYVWDGVKGLA